MVWAACSWLLLVCAALLRRRRMLIGLRRPAEEDSAPRTGGPRSAMARAGWSWGLARKTTGAVLAGSAAAAAAMALRAPAVLPWTVWGAAAGYLLVPGTPPKPVGEFADIADVVDLVALCTEAGLSVEGAVHWVAEELAGPTAASFAAVLRARARGQPGEDAWADLAERYPQADLRPVFDALLQASVHGARAAEILREATWHLRQQRLDGVREQAGRLPSRLVVPLAVFIFPAAVVLLLYPALVALHPALGVGG